MVAVDADARVHPMMGQSKPGGTTLYEDEEEQNILGAQQYRNSGDADMVHHQAAGGIFNSSNIVMEPVVDRRYVGRTSGSGEIVVRA